jgi:hypothetical protein
MRGARTHFSFRRTETKNISLEESRGALHLQAAARDSLAFGAVLRRRRGRNGPVISVFERREEDLRYGIIPTVALAVSADFEAERRERRAIVSAGVLAATVRMVLLPWRWCSAANGFVQGRGRKLAASVASSAEPTMRCETWR